MLKFSIDFLLAINVVIQVINYKIHVEGNTNCNIKSIYNHPCHCRIPKSR